MYGFRYSPLGLPSHNVQALVGVAPPISQGVHLYEWLSPDWVVIQWSADLWWTRFLLVGHNVFLGTRHERLCSIDNTSRFLGWWLSCTSMQDRHRFFLRPQLSRLLQHVRRKTSHARHAWLHGHHGMIHVLYRMHREVGKQHPMVLRPCLGGTGTGPEDLRFSAARNRWVRTQIRLSSVANGPMAEANASVSGQSAGHPLQCVGYRFPTPSAV